MSDRANEREVAMAAAREAGTLLRTMQFRVSVREKGPADLVTEADTRAQQLIRDHVLSRWPDDAFLGEEDLERTKTLAELPDLQRCWIVDPLDGTTNYVHGLDNYGVSIALVERGRPTVGVVYDPVRDEVYQGELGEGAWLNGERLKSSPTQRLSEALVAASLPARVEPGSAEVDLFLRVLYRAQAVRRLGSAALNLCYVARGTVDAFWATSVHAWDVAAGMLLVSEAGGIASQLDLNPIDLRRPLILTSATRPLHHELSSLLTEVVG